MSYWILPIGIVTIFAWLFKWNKNVIRLLRFQVYQVVGEFQNYRQVELQKPASIYVRKTPMAVDMMQVRNFVYNSW